ncbi:MAG: Thermostable beta-glucosidase B [Tenericutes bacterium ADurb.Bin087]|nr:MAG: Thermostable beta-glucosidase B [Tenericutes bacterium ADurb.Bin087]
MTNEELKTLLHTLSLEAKLKLLTGANFWESEKVAGTNLPIIVMNDGPFGVRKPTVNLDSGMLMEVYPATAFPTTSALASSFDPELLEKMGQALATECIDQGVDLLLGPGINIKRSPLCGRNFEYFSEDPYLTSEMATGLVKGLQSKGVGATLKHYAANNQEKERYTTNAIVDARALNEIYLKAFHDVIKNAKPFSVMCSYNQINGRHASRNYKLLTEKLRNEANFAGLIVSDWGAVVNHVDSINAGLNLEMPGGHQDTKELEAAVKKGDLKLETIDEMITPLLKFMMYKRDNPKKQIKCEYIKNLEVAQEIAENSAVLLKNEDNILPISPTAKIALIGNFAKNPRYQGSGSSRINPHTLISVHDAFVKNNVNFVYADGYLEHEVIPNVKKIEEAVYVAKKCDVAVLCVGLPESYEVEGYDRKTLDMPPSHTALIEAVAKVNPNVIVVLSTGSAVTMPWINNAKGILLMHLAGSMTGPATHNLLFGQVNPSGKLSETYPLSLAKGLPGAAFLTSDQNVLYRESLYVGYRYYDTFKEQILFPFGYGLSYTQFVIRNHEIKEVKAGYEVSAEITNIGHLRGGEVIGIYTGKDNSLLYGPRKELKAFKKVFLDPGEKKIVKLFLPKESLKAYDPIKKKWVLENTTYNIFVGINVQNAEEMFQIDITDGENLAHLKEYKNANNVYYKHNSFEPTIKDFATLFGGDSLPLYFPNRKRPFTLESNIGDTTDYWWGRRVYNMMINTSRKLAGKDAVLQEMAIETVKELPFRSLTALSSGEVGNNQRDGILLIVNGKPLRGIIKFLKKKK